MRIPDEDEVKGVMTLDSETTTIGCDHETARLLPFHTFGTQLAMGFFLDEEPMGIGFFSMKNRSATCVSQVVTDGSRSARANAFIFKAMRARKGPF
jgi:hypothetical protein